MGRKPIVGVEVEFVRDELGSEAPFDSAVEEVPEFADQGHDRIRDRLLTSVWFGFVGGGARPGGEA